MPTRGRTGRRDRYGDRMNRDDHQRAAMRTARDKDAPDEFMHLVLGLVDEAGEIAEKVKKLVRDRNSNLTQLDRNDMASDSATCFGTRRFWPATTAENCRVCRVACGGFGLAEFADKKLVNARQAHRSQRGMVPTSARPSRTISATTSSAPRSRAKPGGRGVRHRRCRDARVPAVGGLLDHPRPRCNHHEVDIAVGAYFAAGHGSEHDDGLDIRRSRAHDARQHLNWAGQGAKGSDGLVALVDAVYACSTDRLGRDHAEYPLEVPEGLLNGARAVAACECINAPARQRRPGAQQHLREEGAAQMQEPSGPVRRGPDAANRAHTLFSFSVTGEWHQPLPGEPGRSGVDPGRGWATLQVRGGDGPPCSDVVVELELVRVRAQLHGQDLVGALVVDPGLDQVRR